MKEAGFYQKIEGNRVQCTLCPHHCVISEEKRGRCGVRKNQKGILYSLVYEKACACNIDPIEKKPFFHFFPGSTSLSVSTVGCNLSCLFCQNSDISQEVKKVGEVYGFSLPTSEIVRQAKTHRCQSISYTYTEPTVFFEYAFDTAVSAKKEGIYNNFVTNGYTEAEPIKAIAPYLDAANVDLKSFREEYYQKLCGGKLKPVLDTLILMKSSGIWIEVTTLVLPDQNDSDQELKDIALFIKENLGAETPWHISRFFPQYRIGNLPPTPPETLTRAREIGMESGLKFVYSGNVPGDRGENTYCPNCGKIVIGRYGFTITEKHLKNNTCSFCGHSLAGLFASEGDKDVIQGKAG